jgi:hypothetical protein
MPTILTFAKSQNTILISMANMKGGTQVMVLTGVPYTCLGLPELDDVSTGARSENIQHTVYKGMMLPLAVLAGLTALVYRHTRSDDHKGGDDDAS